jgi:GNAT superfamily N-acetyltransferase
MEQEIEIRAGRPEDLATFLQFYSLLLESEFAFDSTLDKEFPGRADGRQYLLDRLSKDDAIGFLAYSGEECVGYLIGSIVLAEPYRTLKKIGELESMFVFPEQREKGVGGRLMDKFTGWARARGAHRMRVVAPSANVRVIEFYRHFNFTEYDLILEREI